MTTLLLQKKKYISLLIVLCTFVTCTAQTLYTPFPSTFRNTHVNELINGGELHMVFKKLKSGKPVKVMQIGDSHVRGNYLPKSLGNTLNRYFPNVTFTYYGINGAWMKRFYEQDMIQRVVNEQPDLVVISFGTNEAHGRPIDFATHAQTMTLLTSRIKERCHNVTFIFTTPPGSYIKQNGSKVPNISNTSRVAQSIVNYCRTNHYAVWDIFNIAGGAVACTNWSTAGLMAADQIHYQGTGYNLQGKLLGEAIHKAYTITPISGAQTRMMHGSTPQEAKPYKSLRGL